MAREKTVKPAASGVIKTDRRGGQPPHVPNDDTRATVLNLSRAGIPVERIANVMKLSSDTIARHYKYELDTAKDAAIGAVSGTLFAKALSGDVTSMIFFLKTKGGWSETSKLNLSGPNDGPIQAEVLDFSELDREGKLALRIALQTAIAKKKEQKS